MQTRTSRIQPFGIAFLLAAFSVCAAFGQPPSPNKDWNLDVVRLKNGYVLKGLILEESAAALRFQNVRRSTGRPTVCMTAIVRRTEIDRIEKISDADRELLRNRLKELDPSGEGERKRMESLELQIVAWNGKSKAGRRYDSDHFSLVSNAPEEVVRRAAVRLEQIYAAYVHFLPPRYRGGRPTTIMLYPALDDYQKMLDAQGWKLQNPAFFDPTSNRIVCGSNLEMLGKNLESLRQKNQEWLAEIDKSEVELRKLPLKPQELAERLAPHQRYRRIIAEKDKYNDGIYDKATKRLFEILYHEAFHAYVANFVFPAVPKDASADGPPGELPRWLNEGLAQIFETAIVEAGELRVGHADKERLQQVKDALRVGEMMSVKELLTSIPKNFIVQHREDRIASDKCYLASWALASYLTFDRRVLGSGNLDVFVRALNQNENPEVAFARMTGQKLPEFEKEFHLWLTRLQPDGSLQEMVIGKDR